MNEYVVRLIDGSAFGVIAADELDAVLEAGGVAGQDVGHLVVDVEAA